MAEILKPEDYLRNVTLACARGDVKARFTLIAHDAALLVT